MKVVIGIVIVLLLVGLVIYLAIKLNPAFGKNPDGERLVRIENSPNYADGRFHNPVETDVQSDDVPFFKLMKLFFFPEGEVEPKQPIETYPLQANDFTALDRELKFCWLGHSTLLIEIDGVRILTDPVFSERTSPFSFLGSKKFKFTNDYSLKNLPKIDLVLLSHDHYDHLDYAVIKQLVGQSNHFVTALGVGSHLEFWGITKDRITELDWGESFSFNDSLKLTATPARHFTGRFVNNRFTTLWASWVIEGSQNKLFFGADSGYFDGFKTIGETYGPFDLAFLECGQYSQYWPLIHMAPEETYKAALDLQAQKMVPIHWAKFRLSIHPWKEPVERLLKAAAADSARVLSPRIGKPFSIDQDDLAERWWRD